MTPLPPALGFLDHRRRYVTQRRRYHGDKFLDVWGEMDGRPILVFVPGGAWLSGARWTSQGHALMARMVRSGWCCLSIDYRTAPRHRWPAPLEDVYAAVDFAQGHAEFVAVAGASAGGHMATLAALDAQADAGVSLYGSYDWVDRSTPWRRLFMTYLERVVVGLPFSADEGLFRASSPILVADGRASSMMIIHGTFDHLIPVAEARMFHHRLSRVSYSTVEYLEIPGAVHGFDLLHPRQTAMATRAVEAFLVREFLEETERRALC